MTKNTYDKKSHNILLCKGVYNLLFMIMSF